MNSNPNRPRTRARQACWNARYTTLCLLASWLTVAAMGCEGSSSGVEVAPPSDSISDTTAFLPPSPSVYSDTLLHLPFVQSELPKAITWEGNLSDAAHWMDKNGENYLIVSEVFRGELSDRSLVAKLEARCYNFQHDSLGVYWEIKEVNQDYFTFPTAPRKTLLITDLDRDGIAESCFIYEVQVDGTAPAKVKLMLHVLGRKYAIRGQLAGMDYERGKVEEKHFDPAFKEIDKMFRDHASRQWDAYEREYYEGWPEVEE